LIFAGQTGTLLFYIVVFITLWSKKWDWKYFGLTKPDWLKTIYKGLFYAIGIFIINDFIIQPIIEFYFGEIDLTEVSGIEGNLLNYIIFILLGWILGGFCEEIIFRGYVLQRLSIILGDKKITWFLSAFLSSIVFGFAHEYQGISGIIVTAVIAFIFCLIFISNKKNLIVLMLTHGIYNMIVITLIYLGKARMITEWVHGLLT
jgi:membrane protease YdiL (CAAX protease family)